MQSQFYSTRKRAVNLTLSEGLVAQAKSCTDNLSATTELLLTEFVAAHKNSELGRRQMADASAELWNSFLSDHGSFAEEYCKL